MDGGTVRFHHKPVPIKILMNYREPGVSNEGATSEQVIRLALKISWKMPLVQSTVVALLKGIRERHHELPVLKKLHCLPVGF